MDGALDESRHEKVRQGMRRAQEEFQQVRNSPHTVSRRRRASSRASETSQGEPASETATETIGAA